MRKSASITCGNALQLDWQSLIDPIPWEQKKQRFDYIFGNPPFIGKHLMNAAQREDIARVFAGVKGAGVLDFVTAWYIKAAAYCNSRIENSDSLSGMKENRTVCAFVSTNSISQGEQVGILWNELFSKYHIKIHFAHRTFKWGNEARGNAAVHVVIIGFSNFDVSDKRIYQYENISGEAHEIRVKNISKFKI